LLKGRVPVPPDRVDPKSEIRDWEGHVPPMTRREKQETMLLYLSLLFDTMPDEEVMALRAHVLATYPPSEDRNRYLELVDGHLALQEFMRRPNSE
jgi:hypothetical protein